MLQKPAGLIVRIVDRLRKRQFNAKLDLLQLPPDAAKEIKRDIEWNEQATKDFSDALAEVAALQLNKANVSSEHSVYANVLIAAGDLTVSHFAALDRLEKLFLEKRAQLEEQGRPPAKP